jgi:fatty-acyl-CoA synthase
MTTRAHHRFWPARLPHAISTPDTSLWENLAVSAKRFPNKTALIFLGSKLSYAELQTGAEKIAAFLQTVGVQKGDRVVLNMQNCPQLVMAHFGILRANAVVVPVNPMNRAEELKHYITDPDAKVAITTADLAADLASASNQLPAGQGLQHLVVTHFTDAFDVNVSGDDAPPAAWHDWLLTRHALPTLNGGQLHAWQEVLACQAPLGPVLAGPNDLAVLPYTSGTTGLPKGCMHPHRTIMHNAIATSVWSGSTHENVGLLAVPMFHITGLTSVMHATIYLGATLGPRTCRPFDFEMASDALDQHSHHGD